MHLHMLVNDDDDDVIVSVEKQGGEQDMKLLRNARKAAGVGGGSMSDDEPLYDSVCSDEDYASIGDNQSVKEESNASSKTQVSASKETIDTVVLAGITVASPVICVAVILSMICRVSLLSSLTQWVCCKICSRWMVCTVWLVECLMPAGLM